MPGGADEEHEHKGCRQQAAMASQRSLTPTRDNEESQAGVWCKSDCSPSLLLFCPPIR